MGERIIGDPARLAEEALKGVEKELRAKFEEAKEGAVRIIDAAFQDALREVEDRVARALSAAEDRLRAEEATLEASTRLKLAQRRSEWIDRVVEEAKKRLEDFFSTEDYRSMLERLVLRAAAQIEAPEIIIEANARDTEILGDILSRIRDGKRLAELAEKHGVRIDPGRMKTVSLRLSDEPAGILGGIRARTPDSRIVVDYSLDLVVEHVARDMRARIARVLFGGEE